MDELVLQRAPEGGMEMVMVKRVPPHAEDGVAVPLSAPDPRFLATAVEIVLEAGDRSSAAGAISGFRVEKKGTIDLVTEVDLECERLCRRVVAERFPDHDVLGEELGGSAGASRVRLPLGIRPARRHHELRPRVAHLLLVARPRNRRARRGRGGVRSLASASSSPPSAVRARSSTARRSPSPPTADADRRAARHRLSVRRAHARHHRLVELLRRLPRARPRHPPARVGRARPVLCRGRPVRRVLGAAPEAVGRRGRGTHRPAKPEDASRAWMGQTSTRRPGIWWPPTGSCTRRCST